MKSLIQQYEFYFKTDYINDYKTNKVLHCKFE